MSFFRSGQASSSALLLAPLILLAACGSRSSGQLPDTNPVTGDGGEELGDAGSIDVDAGDGETDGDARYEVPALPPECDATPSVLASWAYPDWVGRIRATEAWVYASVSSEDGEGLFRIPVAGGEPESLLAWELGDPDDFWLEGDSIVLALDGSLYRVPVEGGEPELLEGQQAGQDPDALCYARDATHLYWYAFDSGGIRRVPLAGGDIETILEAPSIQCPLGLDDTHVTLSNLNALLRVPKSGGSAEPFFQSDGVQLMTQSAPWMVVAGQDQANDGVSAVLQLGDAGKDPIHLLDDLFVHPYNVAAQEGDHMFLVGWTYFTVSDDRRETKRVRVFDSIANNPAAPIACLTPPYDPLLPEGGEDLDVRDVAVNSKAVYVLVQHMGAPRIAEVKR